MERPETERQRGIRLRREARERERERKRQEKEAKEQRKQTIKRAIEYYNQVNNTNFVYLSRVRTHIKRKTGEDLDKEEAEEKLIKDYNNRIRDGGESEQPIKYGSKDYGLARVKVYYKLINPAKIFNDDNLIDVLYTMQELHEKIPANFYFGICIKGFKCEREQDGDTYYIIRTPCTIARTILTDNLDRANDEIANNGHLNEQSNIWYEYNEIQILFEIDQGGAVIPIDDDIKKTYKIFNPTTNKDCGKKCLEQYNILGRRGYMSISDLQAYKPPVPVYATLEEAGECAEFILLYKAPIEILEKEELKIQGGHFIICRRRDYDKIHKEAIAKTEEGKKKIERKIRKQKNKMNEHIKHMKTDDYKREQEKKAQDKIANYRPLIYDIETEQEEREIEIDEVKRNKTFHKPLLIGVCYKIDGEYTYNYYYGANCVEKFINMIISSNFTHIIGYNSGSFDYILLKLEIVKQGGTLEEYRSGANKIMRGSINIQGRNIGVIDLMNFTTGKLEDNLKAYKCQISKGKIDYNKIGKDHSEEFKNELIEYCRLDVIGTYQLYEKLESPYTERGLVFLDLFTSSQGALKILKYYWKINKFNIPDVMSRTLSEFYRAGNNGGRVEVFKREYKSNQYDEIRAGKLKFEDVSDYMDSPDNNSLYPWAMANFKYPLGKPKFTTKYMEGKIGYYECKIYKPKNLKYPVCNDKIYNSYNLFDLNDVIYNNVDIEQMRKYGYRVYIKYGQYWEESDYIFKDYIEEFYKIKKNSEKGSPQYGNAKLMLNSIYGKTLQREKNEVFYTVSNVEEIAEAKLKHKGHNITMEADIENNLLFYTFKKELGDFVREMPHLGGLILSYSKTKIYDMIALTDPYYTDTDSIYIEHKNSHYLDWGNELGQFSNDYEGKIIYGAFTAKKVKYIELLLPSGKIERHYTGKGCYSPKEKDRKHEKDGLTKHDFKNMLKGLEVENVRPFKMVRNLNDGTVEHILNDTKKIKLNDGNRYFKDNNDSYPLGHIATPKREIIQYMKYRGEDKDNKEPIKYIKDCKIEI